METTLSSKSINLRPVQRRQPVHLIRLPLYGRNSHHHHYPPTLYSSNSISLRSAPLFSLPSNSTKRISSIFSSHPKNQYPPSEEPTPKNLKPPPSTFSFKLVALFFAGAFATFTAAAVLFFYSVFVNIQSTIQSIPAITAIATTLNSIEQKEDDDPVIKALRLELTAKMETGGGEDLQGMIDLISKLIELHHHRPEDQIGWLLLKGHMYIFMGDSRSARTVFESILETDRPDRSVVAYRGLVMAAVDVNWSSLEEKESMNMTDASLVHVLLRVYQEDYEGALEEYRAITEQDPGDYRAYLCQGIVYALLRRRDEAQEMFDKYKELVPQGHTPCDPQKYFKD